MSRWPQVRTEKHLEGNQSSNPLSGIQGLPSPGAQPRAAPAARCWEATTAQTLPRQVPTGFWALLGAASLAFMSTPVPAQIPLCFPTAPAQKMYIFLLASWA